MASFPRSEAEIQELSQRVERVLRETNGSLPGGTSFRERLSGLAEEYRDFSRRCIEAEEAVRQLHAGKDQSLAALILATKEALSFFELHSSALGDERARRYAEFIEEALVEGSDRPPAEPRELNAEAESEGVVLLSWRRPRRGAGGRVASYIVERREQRAGGDFNEWKQLTTAYTTEARVVDQPWSRLVEYRVSARNKAGDSAESARVMIYLGTSPP